MTAESLTFSSCAPAPSTLSSWELEAWYEDLQDVLLSDVNGSKSVDLHQSEMKVWDTVDASSIWQSDSLTTCCPMDISYEPSPSLGIDEDFSDSLLEFLVQDSVPSLCSTSVSPAAEEQVPVVPESDSGSVHHTTEDEDSSSPVCGGKRKRGSQPRGGKRLKEREQEGDKKVSELMEENERLKLEIERLSAEVERTRKALIERMVNLKKE